MKRLKMMGDKGKTLSSSLKLSVAEILAAVTAKTTEREKTSGFIWTRKRKWLLFAASSVFASWLLFHGLNWAFPLNVVERPTGVVVRADDGTPLRQFTDEQGFYRYHLGIESVSPFYVKALLAYEDKYFYQHPGVNPISLVRAIGQQLYYGRVVSGGSTLTMQVARLFHPYERSYWGKLEQIFRALQLESQFSKDEILGLYLRHAPMGGNIEGVEAASWRYFGKSAKDLTVNEAALLVVLPQRPSQYRPDRFPVVAQQARNKVLNRLHQQQLIASNELPFYLNEALSGELQPAAKMAPLLSRRLKSQVTNSQSSESTFADIPTFISHQLQSDVESVVARHVEVLPDKLSMAVMVMENASGKVKAYKGSAEFFNEQRAGHVDMPMAIRSPGSTLKPFIYALGLEQGVVHSKSLLSDVPQSFSGYKPENFDQRFDGAVAMDMALKLSKNVPVVAVLDKVTPQAFVESVESADIKLYRHNPNLSIALGGVGISMEQLLAMYSALGRGGEMIFPRYQPGDKKRTARLLSPESSWIIANVLAEIPPPDRFNAAFNRKIAWKTGTSYGFRDAWAIGTSFEYTVAVWVGRPDGSPFVGQTGANQAAPLLFDVFDQLGKEQEQWQQPDKVQQQSICWPSGLAASLVTDEHCKSLHNAYTINGLTPVTIKKQQNLQNLHQWPEVLQHWMSLQREQSDNQATPLKIIFPKDNAHLFLANGQTLLPKANLQDVTWYLNDKPVAGSRISKDKLPQGKNMITACLNQKCDSVSVFIM
ncbi:penicillin-binding protein 1C [Thalassotalea sp. PS06]|uniref:penicillin-binding protein 1C n=1 Tax=Thalassotalea sp. PS06 TaxID=2594005 RepID=UPI0011654EAC|nr:penicillin-binding protein 1C [Thalassotalea sp. PS06]QDP01628.1 penicillin-binding protein 1C [Thalassotalea sp. PS06]